LASGTTLSRICSPRPRLNITSIERHYL
jgi:hypothetical protein